MAQKKLMTDTIKCSSCGMKTNREAQEGQELQESPNYVCDDCQDERQMAEFEEEVADKDADPLRKSFLKNKLSRLNKRVEAREAKAQAK